jgi:hypothetical protein
LFVAFGVNPEVVLRYTLYPHMPVGVYAVQERIAEVPLATAVRFSSWVEEIFSETGVDEADPERV